MELQISERDFSRVKMLGGGGKFVVNSMHWGVIGGCDEASVTVYGPDMLLWDCLNWLRCPVSIFDDAGRLVWWGFVNEAQTRVGKVEIRAGLASMANRVAVAYSYVAVGTTDVGQRKTTAWAVDADSVAEFGYKELLSSQAGMSDAAAEARRAAILAAQRWPAGIANVADTEGSGMVRGRLGYSGAENSNSATLYLSGWWKTLGWQYAPVASGDVVTTTQIVNMVTAFGQFMISTLIETASGVTASAYRDGDTTCLDEVEALLKVGGANSRRLLAKVDAQRRVWIWEEPATTSVGAWMDRSGKLMNEVGVAITDYSSLAGTWCKLRDVVPGVVDVTKMINPGLQFIEGVRWQDGGVKLEFRGQPRIEDMVVF